MREEDDQVRQEKAEKKRLLQQLHQQDMQEKVEARKQKAEANASVEFADKNMLSYLYNEKQHKAFAYREVGDKRLEAVKGYFSNTTSAVDRELKNIEAQAMSKNARFDEEQKRRVDTRKYLELQTKLFQDKQKEERSKLKEAELE